jgi:hypothetical protein
MTNKYYIFGSENSQDYDIMVEIDSIPTDIDKAHSICKDFNNQLTLIYPDKEINSNLIVISDNKIIDCFKGTTDELNNCIFYTYNLHSQKHPNPILSPTERNINEKILRVARFIITFYSRTELRKEIKSALRGNLLQKLEVLKKIDFVKMTDFPDKKERKEDIKKTISFQFGQIFSIIDDFEPDSYTKNGIIKNYPDLKHFLNRKKENDLNILNNYLKRFIYYIETNINDIRLIENINRA